MLLIVLIIILLLAFGGGGGYYGYQRWGTGGGVGIFGRRVSTTLRHMIPEFTEV
jgi:tRNA(Glu) U13 pseudouridine synthase TruD